MIRFYDFRKDANNTEYVLLQVYRFLGDVPLTICVYPVSKLTRIQPYVSHSQTMICEELRSLYDLLEHPHWRSLIQSLCLQPNTDAVGSGDLFSDLY